MSAQLKSYEFIVKEHHLDTFGHVNNSMYLQLFEEARWQIITDGGYGLAEVQKNQKGPVILEITIKFLKELKLREKIKINYETVNYTGKIGQVKQQMINEKNEVACEAVFTVGFFDLVLRRLINPTEEWKKAIGLTS